MANYLVTGAAGFIGAAVARKLMESGHQVITIDNLSTGYRDNIPAGVEFIEGDCGDPEIYRSFPAGDIDAIFHIAGQSSGEISFDDPVYDIRTNAESTLHLLKLAMQRNCQRFIYASTMSVYGAKPNRPVQEDEDCSPQSFYGVGKLASEHYLRIYQQYGIQSTSLRLFNVYGPGQNLANLRQGMVSIFLAQMTNDGRVQVKGDGDRFRDFIYIDDVVDAFLAALTRQESHGQTINVATGKATTVSQLLDAMQTAMKRQVEVIYAGSTSGDIHGIYADVVRMQRLLGIEAKIALSEGLRRMIDAIGA